MTATKPTTDYPENWATTPGIYDGLPEPVYHADTKAASNSQLKLVNRSTAHWRHAMANPTEPTPAMMLGNLTHCLVLEPERFSDRYVVPPKLDRRTKVGKAKAAEFEAENRGKLLITADQRDKAQAMADSVNSHPEAAWLLRDAITEVTVVWRDDERLREHLVDCTSLDDQETVSPEPTGIYCRGRMDVWRPDRNLFADLKTTGDGSPHEWARAFYNFRHFVQAAFYTDAGIWHGYPIEHFVFIVVESQAPFVTTCYRATDAALDYARVLYARDLQQLAHARKSGEYHGYSRAILDVDLPPWAYNRS